MTPEPLDPACPLSRARLRVWAAAVRDAGGPAAADARTLCAVLDTLAAAQSDSLRAVAAANARELARRVSAACC